MATKHPSSMSDESTILFPQIPESPWENHPTCGVLAGQRVAFVGKLGSMNRQEARELVRHQGGIYASRIDRSVHIIVIGADHLDTEDSDVEFEDWWIEARDAGEIEIIDETELCQRLGLAEANETTNLYTPAMLAKLLDVPLKSIRRWHRRGLIVPRQQINKLPYFDFAEVASARRIAKLIASGQSPAVIEAKLTKLAKLAPELERPLSQLSVIVDGKNILFRQGEGLVEPSGQKRFDFEAAERVAEEEAETEQVLTLPEPEEIALAEISTPDEFVRLAVELEDGEDLQGAIDVYRAMSLSFGPSPDTSFRIAELLYQLNDLPGARERYYLAVELEPDYVEARASLGCVLTELGQLEMAVSAFRGALEHHADYPDVHYHLASVLDELSRRDEAELHWKAFLQLAPKSPWADQARERIEG